MPTTQSPSTRGAGTGACPDGDPDDTSMPGYLHTHAGILAGAEILLDGEVLLLYLIDITQSTIIMRESTSDNQWAAWPSTLPAGGTPGNACPVAGKGWRREAGGWRNCSRRRPAACSLSRPGNRRPMRQTKPMCDRISLGKEEDHG
ncbi:hypothetical protein DRH29_04970 [candidate division Kazan bacterium]|uniref:Uncharacterized protein n=1 Tax=candidate division Kazan bacterium TaxID=2202143 RepID=A0A420ZBG2_UNCK3|nr:MAG: hypothetical protein DRH29_04970 [candidate division Kazan bacterium]